ncbi:polymeric immunoglobulin receptor-like [Sparus aurata]|uniref:polymeric immunoglobulin receptor-like n=1 Tax=Sparus aurata TaxID=8175 RepID=UPI0011C1B7D2|nr:polymeric immunoglobulin receptor-like [Sparus aurata]
MICRILLLISLNCVCGTFVVNVTQTSYQAEENHNITLEWTFTTTADTSPDSLYIFCEMKTDHKVSVLFEIRGGVVIPESQDQQFVGRVQWDKDVLRDGRLRLHVSRLRTEDSGQYLCDVRTNYGVDYSECRLNVSATRDRPEPERPDTASRGRTALYCVLGQFAVLVVLFVCNLLLIHRPSEKQKSRRGFKKSSISAGREEKHLSTL